MGLRDLINALINDMPEPMYDCTIDACGRKFKNKENNKKKLAVFVHKDMEIRTFAIHELGMKAEFEHFIFGRPLADIIKLRGLVFKIS